MKIYYDKWKKDRVDRITRTELDIWMVNENNFKGACVALSDNEQILIPIAVLRKLK